MKIRDRIKELRRVKASDILPNPANWRTHPKEQQDAVKGILAEVGIADALLVRETPEGLQLIDGHLRADAAPDTEWPVLVLDVDDSDASKLLAAFDPLAAMAGVDIGKLDDLLKEVHTENEALQAMLDELATDAGIDLGDDDSGEVEDVEPQLDRAMELQEQWGTAEGQLWIIEGKQKHRLLCGDSTKEGDVSKCIGDAKPFIMVTDPPYGVEYDPGWRNEAAAKGLISFAASREGKVENDERVDWTDAYLLFTGAVAYVWHAGRFTADLVVNLRDANFQIRSQVIWRKPAFAISRGHYHWQHEPCWYAVRKGKSSKWCGDRSQSTVWDISNRIKTAEEGKTDHGTQKPIECMARPIRNHGEKDDDVYDPFLGSGTTLLAAEQLGRRCYGIELSPGYVAVILQRMTDAGCECRLTEDH